MNDNTELLNQEDVLEIKYAHGLDLQSSHTLGFLDKTSLFYLIGCNLFSYDTESLKQKLTSFKCKGRIEFIKISSDKKYALFVDIEPKSSSLFFLDLADPERKRLKKFRVLENEIVCSICWSNNLELLACQTAGPNWNLIIFSFNKFDLLDQIKSIPSQLNEQTVEDISFFPNDNKRLLLIGNKLVRIYLYTKKGLKLVYNLDCEFFLINQSWLNKNETICYDKHSNLFLIEPKLNLIRPVKLTNLAALDNSNLSLEEQTESSLTLSQKPSSLFSKKDKISIYSKIQNRSRVFSRINLGNFSIKSLVCARKGFFLSYSQEDTVYFYENSHKELYAYSLSFTIKLKKSDKFKQVDRNFKELIEKILLNEDQSILIAISNRKFVYLCDLNEVFTNNSSQAEFEQILDNIHSDCLTGIDYCIRKCLICTCSQDKWLTLWNYDLNLIELRQNFDEDLFTVALHPSGLYLILTTTNSLKYMTIYSDSVKVTNVLNVRSCTNCIFSNSGHRFAFVHGTIIQVYSSIRFEEIGSIKVQDMGKIKQLRFSKDDHYLLSCSMAGIIRIWNNAQGLSLVCEITSKGLSYVGLDLHPNQEWLFLISTEKSIRQFQLPVSDEIRSLVRPNSEARLMQKFDTKSDENVTCIEISKSGKMICIGTNKGSIRVYLYPNGSFKEYRAHFGSVNKICISYADECLISSSEDGSVIFWSISSRFKESYTDINQSNEEVLMSKVEYLSKSKIIEDYEQKLKESRIETSSLLRSKDVKFNLKEKELKERFNVQIKEVEQRIEGLKLEEQKKIKDFEFKFKNLVQENSERYTEVCKMYAEKIERENRKNDNLKNKIEILKEQIRLNEKKLKESLEKNEIRIYENIESKLNALKEKNASRIEDHEQNIKDLIDFSQDLEDILEDEIFKLKLGFQNDLFEFLEQNDLMKIELAKLRIEFNLLKENIKDYLKNVYRPKNDILEIKIQIRELDLKEVKFKNEIGTRENEIETKGDEFEVFIKECDDLESDNLVLEKKLDFYKKSELEPIKLENKQLSVQCDEIQNELKHKELELKKLINEILTLKKKLKLEKNFCKISILANKKNKA